MIQGHKSLITLCLLGFLLCLSVWLQYHMFLNWDLCWLMDATSRFLHGGSYVHSFFEVDPPFILYVYMPPVWLAHITGINPVLLMRSYIYVMIIISLAIVRYLLQRCFAHPSRLSLSLLLGCAVTFLLLPGHEFGQREHITLVLTAPYMLLLLARLRAITTNTKLNIVIGFLAGIAFLTKPYFLLVFGLLELWMMWRKHHLLSWLRTEVYMVLLVCLLYAIAIFQFNSDYIHVLVPYLVHLYTQVGTNSWFALTITAYIVILSILILAAAQNIKAWDKDLMGLLGCCTLGFLITYLWQGKDWYYHMLPFLAYACLFFIAQVYYFLCSPQLIHYSWRWLALVLPCTLMLLLFVNFQLIYQAIPIRMKNNTHNTTNQLIRYVKQHAEGKRIYFFDTGVPPAAVVIYYAHVQSASRFPHFWLLDSALVLQQQPHTKMQQQFILHAEAFTKQAVIEDFTHYQPQLVLVNIAAKKQFLPNINFDFLSYFKQQATFRNIWKHYCYQQKIGHYAIYKRCHEPAKQG